MDGIDQSTIVGSRTRRCQTLKATEPTTLFNNGVAIKQSIAASDTSVLRGFANVQGEW
jgi:hypothetical protein